MGGYHKGAPYKNVRRMPCNVSIVAVSFEGSPRILSQGFDGFLFHRRRRLASDLITFLFTFRCAPRDIFPNKFVCILEIYPYQLKSLVYRIALAIMKEA